MARRKAAAPYVVPAWVLADTGSPMVDLYLDELWERDRAAWEVAFDVVLSTPCWGSGGAA
jgi:hypothetical protein